MRIVGGREQWRNIMIVIMIAVRSMHMHWLCNCCCWRVGIVAMVVVVVIVVMIAIRSVHMRCGACWQVVFMDVLNDTLMAWRKENRTTIFSQQQDQ